MACLKPPLGAQSRRTQCDPLNPGLRLFHSSIPPAETSFAYAAGTHNGSTGRGLGLVQGRALHGIDKQQKPPRAGPKSSNNDDDDVTKHPNEVHTIKHTPSAVQCSFVQKDSMYKRRMRSCCGGGGGGS